MASKFNFGKRLRVTGHEYRKMDDLDYRAALRCGCSCENRFVSKRWHPSFKCYSEDIDKEALLFGTPMYMKVVLRIVARGRWGGGGTRRGGKGFRKVVGVCP